VSSLNPETLFFANSRGLSETQATKLLINGFFNDAIEKMHSLGVSIDFNFDMKKL
jgi:Fe-S cluster assembly scaffold protein SufB